MSKCTFCGNFIEKGTGKMYVLKDATIYFFCSNKCEKNLLKLRRKGANTKWTVTHLKGKQDAKKAEAKHEQAAKEKAETAEKPKPAKKPKAT